jgi:hypothetical protein
MRESWEGVLKGLIWRTDLASSQHRYANVIKGLRKWKASSCGGQDLAEPVYTLTSDTVGSFNAFITLLVTLQQYPYEQKT